MMPDEAQNEKNGLSEEERERLRNLIREYAKEYSTLTPEQREARRLERLKKYPIAFYY